jgi:hypothetical protein
MAPVWTLGPRRRGAFLNEDIKAPEDEDENEATMKCLGRNSINTWSTIGVMAYTW